MPKTIGAAYLAAGGPLGEWGLPISSPISQDDGWRQNFEYASVVSDAENNLQIIGGYSISGVWLSNWSALGGAQGRLGFAVSGVQSLDSRWSH